MFCYYKNNYSILKCTAQLLEDIKEKKLSITFRSDFVDETYEIKYQHIDIDGKRRAIYVKEKGWIESIGAPLNVKIKNYYHEIVQYNNNIEKYLYKSLDIIRHNIRQSSIRYNYINIFRNKKERTSKDIVTDTLLSQNSLDTDIEDEISFLENELFDLFKQNGRK
jgi:hypothetical protein